MASVSASKQAVDTGPATDARAAAAVAGVGQAPTSFGDEFRLQVLEDAALKKIVAQADRGAARQLLGSGNDFVKINALGLLRLIGKLDDLETLSVAVCCRADAAGVRAAAAKALAASSDPDAATSALTTLGSDADPLVVAAAQATVTGFGAAALPALIAALATSSERAERQAIPLIVSLGVGAEAAVVAAFLHDDDRIRQNAITALRALGLPALQRAVTDVRARLRDGNGEVVRAAREAARLINMAERPQMLEPIAMPAPGFDSGSLDAAGLKAAAKIDLADLQQLANDGRPFVRRNAWRVIAARGALDHYTTMFAAVATRDDDGEVRILAAAALHKADRVVAETFIPALLRLRRDKEPSGCDAADAALVANADAFLSLFPGVLDARIDYERDVIVDTCRMIGAKVTGAALRAALDDAGPVVRHTAVYALTALGAGEVLAAWPKLVANLQDPYDPSRAGTVLALGLQPAKIKADRALFDRIHQMYADDGSWMVRDAADKTIRLL